jgi:hypothetical protein
MDSWSEKQIEMKMYVRDELARRGYKKVEVHLEYSSWDNPCVLEATWAAKALAKDGRTLWSSVRLSKWFSQHVTPQQLMNITDLLEWQLR